MKAHVILVTYGEPPGDNFSDQWLYSSRILSKLTRLVVPIPAFTVPFIGAWRGRRRKRLWRSMNYSSPLESITERQVEELQRELLDLAPDNHWQVNLAYEFREPLLSAVLDRIPIESCDQLIMVPMYIPVSDFTSEITRSHYEQYLNKQKSKLPAATWILFRSQMKDLGRLMARFVLAESEALGISRESRKEAGLLLGCHGTIMYPPPGITDTGYQDTYTLYQNLEENLLPEFRAVNIGWLNHQLGGEWTRPTLLESAQSMLAAGIRHFIYFPFGFLADNAESQLEGRMVMEQAGIQNYHHLSCLNDHREFIHFLAKQVLRNVNDSSPVLEPASLTV